MTRKNPYIIGYCFNSALCCPACTNTAYENGELIRDRPPEGQDREPPTLDQHNLPDDMTNTQYEPVVPVFSTDDYPDGFTCDDCGEHTL
jgi:hypothetical protein